MNIYAVYSVSLCSSEEVVNLVCGLLGQLRGPEAVRALNTVMDVYLHTTSFLRTQGEGMSMFT